jgi:hypothetical protein
MKAKAPIRSAVISAAIAVVLYASGIFAILCPLPMLVVYSTGGRRAGIASAALALAYAGALYAVFAFGGISSVALPGAAVEDAAGKIGTYLVGVGYFVFLLSLGVIMGESIIRRHTAGRTIAAAATFSSVAFAAATAAFYAFGVDVVTWLVNYFTSMLSEFAKVNAEAGIANPYIGMLADRSAEIALYIVKVMPAAAFAFVILTTMVNLVISRRIAAAKGKDSSAMDFSTFRLPDMFVWAVIASGALFFANAYSLHSTPLWIISVNGVVAALVLYFVQGLAVVSYGLQRVRMPLIRLAAYVLIILFFQTISIAIVGLGVADVWVNFRLKKFSFGHGNP